MKQLKKRYKTHRHRRQTETQKTDRERNPPPPKKNWGLWQPETRIFTTYFNIELFSVATAAKLMSYEINYVPDICKTKTMSIKRLHEITTVCLFFLNDKLKFKNKNGCYLLDKMTFNHCFTHLRFFRIYLLLVLLRVNFIYKKLILKKLLVKNISYVTVKL